MFILLWMSPFFPLCLPLSSSCLTFPQAFTTLLSVSIGYAHTFFHSSCDLLSTTVITSLFMCYFSRILPPHPLHPYSTPISSLSFSFCHTMTHTTHTPQIQLTQRFALTNSQLSPNLFQIWNWLRRPFCAFSSHSGPKCNRAYHSAINTSVYLCPIKLGVIRGERLAQLLVLRCCPISIKRINERITNCVYTSLILRNLVCSFLYICSG